MDNTLNNNEINELDKNASADNTNLSVSPLVMPVAETRIKEPDINDASSDVKSDTKVDKPKGFGKKLSKNKKIAIIIIAVVLVLAIAGGTTLAVILLAPKEVKSQLSFVRYEYAMDCDDTVGIIIDGSWRGNWELEEFDLRFTEGDAEKISISKDNIVKFNSTPEEWETFKFTYFLGDEEVAEYEVTAVNVDGFINKATDLENIPSGATGVYVVNADLTAISGIQIDKFCGNLYGNHHTLNGYDVSEKGGLFDYVEKAYITAFNMVDVKGEFKVDYSDSMGVLANVADDSMFVLCNTQGEITAEITASAEELLSTTLNVGGLIGYLNDMPRKSEGDKSVDFVRYCAVDTNINVVGNTKMFIGGIVGSVKNATIITSSYSGNMEVEANSSPILYIGGIAGKVEKVLPTGNKLYSFDGTANLKMYGNIKLDSNGYSSSGTAYVGGIFGSVTNHNVCDVTHTGDIDIDAEGGTIYVAKVVGQAINNSSGVKISMAIERLKLEGELTHNSKEGEIVSAEVVAVNSGEVAF